ncbi:MAG: DNA polymerase III subunit gamma/tau [Candidatus Accumulibacter sp.]|jgi:DNA polymerase-3 subunit gamma/tau|nr:DNA polymerase III subunit gamma/tau [Accumulibacter sp.]
MSYQVLARKWRPKTFETLVGQEHVVRALAHALNEKHLHHAYLFTGTRGVGKTTLARILAKALNCETGVSASPCGVCAACTEIDSGRFVDLLEVDAATNTRVDEMRQLLENAVYAPTRGRFKVYVIDEVHMLSNSAFNAMLKTLEEPPEHVKFILATTDPQKIPVTVLSRCLQFNLKQMMPTLIAEHLQKILSIEGIDAESGALSLLAHSANGSMRDALSLLDQAIAHGGGRIVETTVREMLGTVDLDYLLTILESLLADDASRLLSIAETMTARSLSFDLALQGLATLFTRIQVAQLAPRALDDASPEYARIRDMAARFDPEFVQLAYQIVTHGRKELPLAPDEYAGFVMTLLRLHVFRPAQETDDTDVMEKSQTGKSKEQASPERHAPAPTKASSLKLPEETSPVSPIQGAPLPKKGSGEVSASPTAAAMSSEPGGWQEILDSIELSGMARELARHCDLSRFEGDRVALSLPPAHRHLQIKAAQEKLQQALSSHFGRSLRLSINLEEARGETPADTAQKLQNERQEQAVASIEQNDFVREVIDLFDARLIESSIKPV